MSTLVGRPRYTKKNYNMTKRNRPSYIPRNKFKDNQIYSNRYSKREEKRFLYTRYSSTFGSLAVSPLSQTLGGYQFSLNDVPNYTEFTNLYDMYKINGVKLTFIPQQDANTSLSPVNNAIANARFFSAIDYNDANPPASVDELREYKTAKWTSILRPHVRYIHKPKIFDTSGYSISPWMATTSPSVNYFGLKVAIEPTEATITTTFTYKIEAKFYMEFKNVK